jgi:predicted dehydrogenase
MVGVTRWGRGVTDLFAGLPDLFTVVALVDQTLEIAQSETSRRNWPGMPYFGSFEEALSQIEADACVLTTPARFHAEQIRLALKKGLHVFVSKPMTYDLDEAAELVKLAETEKRCLLVDQQYQFLFTELAVKEWIKTKKYGELGYIDFIIHRHRPAMGAMTGEDPFIWEQGVHMFNSLLAITGRPAISVFTHQIRPPWSVYNGATASMGMIEFEGGLPCHFLGTFESRTTTQEMRFEFEQAAVRVIDPGAVTRRLEVALSGKPFEAVGIDDGQAKDSPQLRNLEAFYRGCTEGGRVINDGRDHLRTLAVIDACIRSAHSGKKEAVRQF